MSELAFLTVAEAAELLRGKKLSPVEYARALIARIERHDGTLNAFLRPAPEIALEDARRAEVEIMRGNWRGPFHGVPYGLKDIIDYAGLPTTAHSKILVENVARADAVVTQKLRVAGGVFMGKLSTHEFAVGGPSFGLPWPPARHPRNPDHFCGGPSSGAPPRSMTRAADSALSGGVFPGAKTTMREGSTRSSPQETMPSTLYAPRSRCSSGNVRSVPAGIMDSADKSGLNVRTGDATPYALPARTRTRAPSRSISGSDAEG